MIVGLKKAILHIMDANSGMNIFSDELLDVENAEINTFIAKHIEKIYDSASLRPAEFKETSGFRARLEQYKSGQASFAELSQTAAERLYEAETASDEPRPADLIVVEFVAGEENIIGILKCDNKTGMTHTVIQDDGKVFNNIINHYAILPPITQKISESAFINLNSGSVRYAGRKHKIDGEPVDVIAELLLECEYEISPRESANTVKRIAKKVALENGADTIAAQARIKEYVTESIEENNYEYVDTGAVADKVFEGLPSMRDEFKEKLERAGVPERVEATKYLTKKMTADIKLSTDTGVNLSFPPEYYKNPDYIEIITNEDGTISIKINNITEIINK
ncbi:MAG: nucleoid-associated protein [Clostridia bacterium]|nr:nucleoid-associated protein [Clostridia bacterium]